MEWLSENWVFVLILVVFVGVHLFGHGGHGGSGHRKVEDKGKSSSSGPGGHRH